MPAYNIEKHIGFSIDSVIAQSFTDWELIIVDDCSTDETSSIIKEYIQRDERIINIQNKKNMGVAAARNAGINIARGEYLAFIDSDDIWDSEKIKIQVGMASEISLPVLIYTSYDFIDEKGDSILKPYIVPRIANFNSMLRENVIGCSSVFVSKTIISEVGGFPIDVYHEDYALWMKLFMRKDMVYLGNTQILMHYRVLKGSKSNNKSNAAKERWKIYREVLGLNLFKSAYYFLGYAVKGVLKHYI